MAWINQGFYLLIILMMLRISIDDLGKRIISNVNVLFVLAILTAATFFAGKSPNIILMISVLIIGFILFSSKVLGAGDVKLIAVLSGSFSYSEFFDFIYLVTLLGGAIGLFGLIFYHKNVKKKGIPYGVPIALAFIISYPFG